MKAPLYLRKWSPAIAHRATLKRLDRIEFLLIEIGGFWGDEDEFLVSQADQLMSDVRQFRQGLDEQIDARRLERAEGVS